MSLLAQINQRNQQAVQDQQQVEADAAAEAQKPDAREMTQAQRRDYGTMLAAGQDVEMAEEDATPEEQELFSDLEMAVAQLINGPRVNQLFKVIQSATDPVEGIGQAAADVVTLVAQSEPEADDEILLAIGESAVEQLVEAYEDVDPSANLSDDQIAEAYSIGVREFMESHQGAVDSDMRQFLAGEAPQVLQGEQPQ